MVVNFDLSKYAEIRSSVKLLILDILLYVFNQVLIAIQMTVIWSILKCRISAIYFENKVYWIAKGSTLIFYFCLIANVTKIFMLLTRAWSNTT